MRAHSSRSRMTWSWVRVSAACIVGLFVMHVFGCVARNGAIRSQSSRVSHGAQDQRVFVLEQIRAWNYEAGYFVSCDAVNAALGAPLQAPAWFDQFGLQTPRLESMYPLEPGTMVWVVFQSIDESELVIQRRMDDFQKKAERGEIRPTDFARLVDASKRSLRALSRYRAECLMREMVASHAVFAELHREPVPTWVERLESAGVRWLQLGFPSTAAIFLERAADADGANEQLFWRAAVAYTAAGRRASATANLEQFRSLASREQLDAAASSIAELESRIAELEESR